MRTPLINCLLVLFLFCGVATPFAWSDEMVRTPPKAAATETASPPGNEAIDQAMVQARKADKKLLVVFSAEWCRWCRQMDTLLAKPELAKLLTVDFVVVKIDIDKMQGGREIYRKYCAKPGGIPWIAVIGADGELKGSFEGYPLHAEHLESFMGLLTANRTKLTDDQIGSIKEILKSASPASANATKQ